MQETRQRIIRLLKSNGGLTTGELSDIVGISATAVRRHLTKLEAEDLVCHRAEQRGMGRPSFVYELTESTPNVFRQTFTDFVNSVLRDLDGLDGYLEPDEFFNQRQQVRHQKYVALTKGDTLPARIASLARLMESEGRMTTWQQVNENQFILRAHNCPFYRLNGKLKDACHCEMSLLGTALRAKVDRVNHILKGDVACVYTIDDQRNGTNVRLREGHQSLLQPAVT
jgi:predicted ArsR family transcriptional regulator